MRYSEIFDVPEDALEAKGVFNADVDSDSKLHIDPSLFKGCKIPEFADAYNEFNGYFAKIFLGLVPYAKDNQKVFDLLVKRLSFREIANTCLGYSKSGTHGSGIGGKLAIQIAKTILEIYDIGIKNPVVFELMPFFEEGIGADRISDMSAYLLIRKLIDYTQRVCRELNIPMQASVKLDGKPIELPTYRNIGYVFVPNEVLCDLPTATSHDDIDSVCYYNDMFRRRICQAIGEQWKDFKNASKSRIKQLLLKNPDMFKDFINEYENTKHLPYNFVNDKKHVMGRCFSSVIRGAADNKHIQITFNNQEQAKSAISLLSKCDQIARVSLSDSEDEELRNRVLNVVPIDFSKVADVEQIVNKTLQKFFLTRTILKEETVAFPAFEEIRQLIIDELKKAVNTIYVCVAWFTDEELRDVLLTKLNEGVDVRVITYQDGVNKKHGVDFKEIPNIKIRGERGGIMHRKYCIIDNHVTISGSYNWTDNASEHNDENIEIIQDWNNANTCTRQFLNDWNKNHDI